MASGEKRAATDAATADAASKQPRKFVLERGSEPALSLLDALGVPRATALEGLADRAAERLVELVPSMPARRRLVLLTASFAHIDSPRLRPIAVAALEHTPELPQEIMSALTGDRKELLGTLPLRVRQRVWESEDPPTLNAP